LLTVRSIREHNLLHLTFLPNPTASGPLVTFLWLSPSMTLQMQTRILSSSSHSFIEVSRPIDVVSPTRSPPIDADADFNLVPFSCPAARRVMPIPTTSSHERMILVMGDEHSVLYSLALVPQSPRASRLSGSSNVATSPRASAVKRSPQTEMVGAQVKKRKSSMTAKRPSLDGGERWEMRPVWRIRQGFGTILAYARST
jgi:DNA damage-binding protein 1